MYASVTVQWWQGTAGLWWQSYAWGSITIWYFLWQTASIIVKWWQGTTSWWLSRWFTCSNVVALSVDTSWGIGTTTCWAGWDVTIWGGSIGTLTTNGWGGWTVWGKAGNATLSWYMTIWTLNAIGGTGSTTNGGGGSISITNGCNIWTLNTYSGNWAWTLTGWRTITLWGNCTFWTFNVSNFGTYTVSGNSSFLFSTTTANTFDFKFISTSLQTLSVFDTIIYKYNYSLDTLIPIKGNLTTSDISGLSAALSAKEDSITAGTTSQYRRGDKPWQTLDKAAVWLSNVDNTSDSTKNSATATLTNKTLVAPILGTPASWDLSLCTADWTNAVWFKERPQNSQSTAYTLVLTDSGKHIYHPSADTTARTWTIPANSSVAYPIWTSITFVNDTSAWAITIAITTDTLVLAWSGSTGSRTLAANGIATAIKVTSTRRVINGTNLT